MNNIEYNKQTRASSKPNSGPIETKLRPRFKIIKPRQKIRNIEYNKQEIQPQQQKYKYSSLPLLGKTLTFVLTFYTL